MTGLSRGHTAQVAVVRSSQGVLWTGRGNYLVPVLFGAGPESDKQVCLSLEIDPC